MRLPYRETSDGLLLFVRLQPGARKVSIGGLRADAAARVWLEARVTAPPEDGKANVALIKLLARTLGLPKSAVEITAGHASREKTLLLRGEARGLAPRLKAVLSGQAVSE